MNKTSFNEDSFMDNRSLIAGYPEGRIILVTYFSQNHPVIDTYSRPADVNQMTYNDVHISWTQIRNFEIRVQNEISAEYSSDKNFTTVQSQGIVLPGFVPRIGDVFLYKLRNGKIGMFYISDIQRLALGQETYHQISFRLQEWLDSTVRDRLQKQSTGIFYFDKEKFLTGNVAMMTTTGYIEKKELLHIRREIVQNYMDRFYDTDFSTLIRPDKVYDPYIVEYWLRKVSCEETIERPIQLFPVLQNFKKTIWSALTNNPIKNLKNISREFHIATDFHTFWDINITALIGHQFLYVGNERGAVKSPTINTDGTPNSINAYPYNLGYYEPWRSRFHKSSNEQFAIDRFWFYRGFLPFRRCAPHQHSIDYFTNQYACNPQSCVSCYTDKEHNHHLNNFFHPPFPIKSNEELGKIWRTINHIAADAKLSNTQLAEVRGYILWYRTEYPGTLSDTELEEMWRNEANIAKDKILTDDEQNVLKQYIHTYREKFLPILNNREVEYIWRYKNHIDFNKSLTTAEISSVRAFLKQYRNNHGNPLKANSTIPLGTIFTSKELEYNKILLQYSEQNDTYNEKSMIDGLPAIYHRDFPRPHQHVHCHSICHLKCQDYHTKSDENDTTNSNSDSYVLSNEFYLGSTAMSPFEHLIYDCLMNNEVNPELILKAVEGYLDLDDNTAFYQHLLSLYLIDKALFWLKYHS